MKTWVGLAIVSSIPLLVLAGAPRADAYNEPTHETINRFPGAHVTVDGPLRDTLGLLFGLETPIRDRNGTTRSVLDWLAVGGFEEDQPICRRARHFHDPTQPWDNAGLRTLNALGLVRCLSTQFESSVRAPASVPWLLFGAIRSNP